MSRYIWLGTVSFDSPNFINGEPYTHMSGTAVHYGTNFKHMVAGDLWAKQFAANHSVYWHDTHERCANEWYNAKKNVGRWIGHLVPNSLNFSISL